MKLAKDLLYDKDNQHLDIARFAALMSVIGYIGVTVYAITKGTIAFDPFEWGSGWAAICGGNAAWIFARQRYEAGIPYNPPSKQTASTDGYDDMRSPRAYDDPYDSPRLL